MAHDEFMWLTSHFCPIAGATDRKPMDLATSIQAYVDAGVPRAKMGIGIGFYATNWAPPVTGPDQEPNGARVQSNDLEWMYGNLVTKGYLSNGVETWDATAGMHYRTYAGGYQPPGASNSGFLSYEDEASIAAKAAWVKATGVGGAIIWMVNYGTTDGVDNPLMAAVKQSFRS
jgi:chitinase